MSDEEDHLTLSIQLANQIINLANSRLQDGLDPLDIAAGMRHAAANFSAFAVASSRKEQELDPLRFAEEFVQTFDYYFERHRKAIAPTSGLEALVRQVRDES